MSKRLVFVGGGHAHLTCLKNIRNFISPGHRVTLINPSPYHYYSGMGPGMLSGIYLHWEARFHVRKMAEDRGAAFIMGKVIRCDPRQHLLFLQSGEEVPYDVVSFNTGSDVPTGLLTDAPRENLFPVKPVVNLLRARHTILSALKGYGAFRYVVVGGGPAGVEISGNLWRLLHDNHMQGQFTLVAGKRLLPEAPEKVRQLAMKSLEGRGVQVIEGSHVKTVEKGKVILTDGHGLQFDLVLAAIGIRPSSLFEDSAIPVGPDGGLLVNRFLQSVAFPDVFGGGDCISFEGYSLAKVGVYAVRQNPILYHNIMAALEGGEMAVFSPQREFLLILNMGNGKGIFWKKNWVWEGRLAFLIKNFIDKRFMRNFQVSGELADKAEMTG